MSERKEKPAGPGDKAEVDHLREELRGLVLEVGRLAGQVERLRSPPHIVGTLLDCLDDGRLVVKSSTGPNFVVPAVGIDPKSLVIGQQVALNQQNMSVIGALPRRDPIVDRVSRTAVTYDDIAGMDEVVLEVREAVEFPITRAKDYARLGVVPPKGVLLTGPPGTGKTLLAQAVAHASQAKFIHLAGSELVQKFIGEGARRVREIFASARDKAPAIIFIDELDALASRREGEGVASSREVERTMMQLLTELDGFDARGDVRIMAATNRVDVLDPAIVRPGRFDRVIEVPMPDAEALASILKLHTRPLKIDVGFDLPGVASQLAGATGADVRAVCTEAGMHAVRHGHEAIGMVDFDAALARWNRQGTPAPDLYV